MGSGKKQPILGAVAGALIGFFGASVFEFQTNDPAFADQQAWNVVWVITGLGSFATAMLGRTANRPIKGRTRDALIGLLGGVFVGLLAGAAIGDLLVEREIETGRWAGDDILSIKMREFARVNYRTACSCFGMIIGGVLGGGIGLLLRGRPRRIE